MWGSSYIQLRVSILAHEICSFLAEQWCLELGGGDVVNEVEGWTDEDLGASRAWLGRGRAWPGPSQGLPVSLRGVPTYVLARPARYLLGNTR